MWPKRKKDETRLVSYRIKTSELSLVARFTVGLIALGKFLKNNQLDSALLRRDLDHCWELLELPSPAEYLTWLNRSAYKTALFPEQLSDEISEQVHSAGLDSEQLLRSLKHLEEILLPYFYCAADNRSVQDDLWAVLEFTGESCWPPLEAFMWSQFFESSGWGRFDEELFREWKKFR